MHYIAIKNVILVFDSVYVYQLFLLISFNYSFLVHFSPELHYKRRTNKSVEKQCILLRVACGFGDLLKRKQQENVKCHWSIFVTML